MKLHYLAALSTLPVSGTKKSKERITFVFLTCNATGEEKFPPLFIHKFENPRPIKNIDNQVYQFDITGRSVDAKLRL